MSCIESFEELLADSVTAAGFESRMRKAGIPFVSSDDPPDVVQAFNDKYPSADDLVFFRDRPGGREGTWFTVAI